MLDLRGLHDEVSDDEVPRKRGRPYRAFSQADMENGKPRSNGKRCKDCPKYRNWWCMVSARIVKPSAPACRYGKVIMRTSADMP